MIWIKRLNEYGLPNWVITLLILLSFVSMVAQIVGLGIFLPIFEFIFQSGKGQLAEGSENLLLNYINIFIESVGLDPSLESLLLLHFFFI